MSDNTVKITLKHGGYKTVCELGAENLFKIAVRNKFGIETSVSFDGQLEDVEIELPPPEAPAPREPKQQKPKAEAPKTEIKLEKSRVKSSL